MCAKAETPQLCLRHAADCLDPAIRLLDPLANDLAHPVTLVARGPPVDVRAAVGVDVPGHVWGYADVPRRGDERCGVVVLVALDGLFSRIGALAQHLKRRFGLRSASRVRQAPIDNHPVPVFHQQVPSEAKRRIEEGKIQGLAADPIV